MGDPRACSPANIFETYGPQTAGDALKLSTYHLKLFCITLNLLRSHQEDLFGSWGWGEGGACAPRAYPLSTGLA